LATRSRCAGWSSSPPTSRLADQRLDLDLRALVDDLHADLLVLRGDDDE
jgi:hypothetical protein